MARVPANRNFTCQTIISFQDALSSVTANLFLCLHMQAILDPLLKRSKVTIEMPHTSPHKNSYVLQKEPISSQVFVFLKPSEDCSTQCVKLLEQFPLLLQRIMLTKLDQPFMIVCSRNSYRSSRITKEASKVSLQFDNVFIRF